MQEKQPLTNDVEADLGRQNTANALCATALSGLTVRLDHATHIAPTGSTRDYRSDAVAARGERYRVAPLLHGQIPLTYVANLTPTAGSPLA